MSTNLRFGLQLQLCQSISNLDQDDSHFFFQFVDLLAKELHVKDGPTWIANMFLHNKYKLSDNSTKLLHNLTTNYLHKHKTQKSKKKSMIELMPNDVLNHIGRYLTIKTSLNLSISNHTLHKMVQTQEYFDQCGDNEIESLTLNQNMIDTICQNNCSLHCFISKCRQLEIKCIAPFDIHRNINSSDCCVLQTLFNNASKMTNPNFDLQWIEKLLSRIECLFINNKWYCGFDHLPMEWLFNKTKYNKNIPIDIIGSDPNDDENQDLSPAAAKKFGCQFNQYFRKYQKYQKYQKCQNGIDRNGNKNNMSAEVPVRQIDRIWLNNANTPIFDILDQLNRNYSGVILTVPATIDNRFTSLLQFVRIINQNVRWFELIFGDENSITGGRRSGHGFSIVQEFFKFKNNSQLQQNNQNLIDFDKLESKLTFSKFLNGHGICMNDLPQIEQLAVVLSSSHFDMFGSFLTHEKLMKLFNFDNSLKKITLTLSNRMTNGIENMINLLIQRLNCISHLVLGIRMFDGSYDYGYECATHDISDEAISADITYFNKFYSQSLVPILTDCVRYSTSLNKIELLWGDAYQNDSIVFENKIVIQSQFQHQQETEETQEMKRIATECSKRMITLWKSKKPIIASNEDVWVEKFSIERKYTL